MNMSCHFTKDANVLPIQGLFFDCSVEFGHISSEDRRIPLTNEVSRVGSADAKSRRPRLTVVSAAGIYAVTIGESISQTKLPGEYIFPHFWNLSGHTRDVEDLQVELKLDGCLIARGGEEYVLQHTTSI